jgi:hypothetical protein
MKTQSTPAQLELPLTPRLKVIKGLGQKKSAESLSSRDAVARVLIETGADLLLNRITHARAEAIEHEVDQILALFDRVEKNPQALPELSRRLDALESLMRETRERAVRQRR